MASRRRQANAATVALKEQPNDHRYP
jgi:hypothetical protein